ncbi:hypothetical protein QQ045_015660 [Rhodiola kirilowii]
MASLRIIVSVVLLLAVNGASAVTVPSELVLEEGYTVTTVIDGNKIGVNPHSILPRFGSFDFVVLDSAQSGFYTISSPISQESVIVRLAGNGSAGFADGDLRSSVFNKPKSFVIDLKGNVYVADQSNHVIRKITSSGVTTIAGGYSRKPGHADGPAQQALFSNDFELTFVPELCALLISDHGSMLVRQLDLKPDDCRVGSHSALGTTFTWILGLGLSCILGLVIGFVARPYVTSYKGSWFLSLMRIWNLYRINVEKQVVTFCFDIRSAIADSTPYMLLRKFILLYLSYLSLIMSLNIVNTKPAHVQPVSLMDSDVVFTRTEVKQLDQFATQLKDLSTFDGISQATSALPNSTPGIEYINDMASSSAATLSKHGTLETMIHSNLMDFVAANPSPESESLEPATTYILRKRLALIIQ